MIGDIKQRIAKIDKDKIKGQALSFLTELKNKISFQDLEKVKIKLPNMNRGALKEVWDNVGDLWFFVNNKDVSIVEKTLPLAALVYVISPLDVIPDTFPLAGLLDDASIVTYAFAAIATQISDIRSITSLTEKKNELKCIPENTESYKEKITVLTSILSHAAYADGEMCPIEEKKIKDIINFFIFSEDGWFSTLEELNNTKEEIKILIDNTIKQPLSIKKITEFVNSPSEEEELWYFYAYAVIAADDEIKASEREFLEYLGEQFNLSKFDISNIEKNFKETWLME